MAGLLRACEKTPVTHIELEQIVSRVENELYERGDPEIASNEVGKLIMDCLADVNEVAYVRFASVYRRFKDIASFENELSRIREDHSHSSSD
jgi:transcriptional repressor NrdR